MTQALDRYGQLVAKVEDFFQRVSRRFPEQIHCGEGCNDCCQGGLEVVHVEAAAITEHIKGMAEPARQELADHLRGDEAASTPSDRCVALAGDGRCLIYAARPLVCRSHGVPIRMGHRLVDEGRTRLPIVETCFRNFTGPEGVEAADESDILDQTTLSTMLLAIDREHAGERGGKAGDRVALADLLRRLIRDRQAA